MRAVSSWRTPMYFWSDRVSRPSTGIRAGARASSTKNVCFLRTSQLCRRYVLIDVFDGHGRENRHAGRRVAREPVNGRITVVFGIVWKRRQRRAGPPTSRRVISARNFAPKNGNYDAWWPRRESRPNAGTRFRSGRSANLIRDSSRRGDQRRTDFYEPLIRSSAARGNENHRQTSIAGGRHDPIVTMYGRARRTCFSSANFMRTTTEYEDEPSNARRSRCTFLVCRNDVFVRTCTFIKTNKIAVDRSLF